MQLGPFSCRHLCFLAWLALGAACTDVSGQLPGSSSESLATPAGFRVKPILWWTSNTSSLVGTSEFSFSWLQRELGLPYKGNGYPNCNEAQSIDDFVACIAREDPYPEKRTQIAAPRYETSSGSQCTKIINGQQAQTVWMWWSNGNASAGIGWCFTPEPKCPDGYQLEYNYDNQPDNQYIASCLLTDEKGYASSSPDECPGPEGFTPTTGDIAVVSEDYRSVHGDLDFVRIYRNSTGGESNLTNATRVDLAPGLGDEPSRGFLTLPYYGSGAWPPTRRMGRFQIMERYRVEQNTAAGLPDFLAFNTEDGDHVSLTVDAATRTAQSFGVEPDFVAIVPSSGVGWEITGKDGTYLKVNELGLVTEQINANGQHASIEYDAQYHPVKKTNNLGNSIYFEHNADGDLSKFTDEAGNSITYTYNNHRINDVTYPDGRVIQYLYDEAALAPKPMNLLTGRIERFDGVERRISSIRYDEGGAVISTAGPNGAGQLTIVSRVPAPTGGGQIVTTIDANGVTANLRTVAVNRELRIIERDQPPGAGCTASTMKAGFDTYGRLADFYDFNGHRTCVTNSENLIFRLVSENVDPAFRCTSYNDRQFDSWYRPPTHDPLQRNTWIRRDPDLDKDLYVVAPQTLTEHVFHGHARMGKASQWAVTPDPAGPVVLCAPDTPELMQRGLLCETRVQRTLDANGSEGFFPTMPPAGDPRAYESIIRYTYNAAGQVTSIDDNGLVLRFEYAAATSDTHRLSDLTAIIEPNGVRTVFTRYDNSGRWVQMQHRGVTTSREFDVRGRVKTETRTAGELPSQITSYTYHRGSDFIESITAPDSTVTRFGYDAALRLNSITNPLGQSENIQFHTGGQVLIRKILHSDGSLWSQIQQQLDALGRVQYLTGVAP